MELLIRIVDSYKLTGDDTFDAKVSRRGDVIVAMPDGWNWGKDELSAPFWRILRLPDVSPPMAETFTSAEPAASNLPGAEAMTQFRGFKFDCDNPDLALEVQAYLADDKRAVASLEVKGFDDTMIQPMKYNKRTWADYKPAVAAAETAPIVKK